MKSAILIIALLGLAASSYVGSVQDASCQNNKQVGFYWDGQVCQPCQVGCYCSSIYGCSSCQAGKIVVDAKAYTNDQNTKQVNQCLDCPAYASNCCQDGSANHASACNAVVNAAAKDNSVVRLFGSVCKSVPNCATLSDTGLCTACLAGHYLDNTGTCSACNAASCATCTAGDGQCDTCKPGYYLASTADNSGTTLANDIQTNANLCKPCTASCTCSIGTALCSGCDNTLKNHYYDTAAKTCTACDQNNLGCITCSSATVCTSCGVVPGTSVGHNAEYVLDNKTPAVCQPFDDKCVEGQCSYDTKTSLPVCAQCTNGFYLDATTKKCTACPQNKAVRCKGKDNKDITQCGVLDSAAAPGTPKVFAVPPVAAAYFVVQAASSSLACQQNTNLCQTMTTSVVSGEIGQCTACYTGYYVNGLGACAPCNAIAGCVTCATKAKVAALTCQSCKAAEDNKSYTDPVKFNYVLNVDKCDKCTGGSLTCSSISASTTCQSRYRLDSKSKSCQLCTVDNCKSCDAGAATCTACYAGYRVWKAKTGTVVACEACEANCDSCEGSRKTCTKCKVGFYLSNGHCKADRSGCQSAYVKSNGDCEKCITGYRHLNRNCVKCNDVGSYSAANYINCLTACGTSHYANDGVTDFSPRNGSSANILALAIINLLLVFALLF